jgi:hypothetical protein
MENLALSEKLDLFFSKPYSEGDEPKIYSNLHLLRKHVNICLGIDPIGPQAIWPGAMAILAGIDLLGLYYSGGRKIPIKSIEVETYKSDSSSFMRFCEEFLELENDDSEIIYMFRNALLHTYGLITTNEIRKDKYGNDNINYGKEYKFNAFYQVDDNWLINQIVDENNKESDCINIHELYIKFESAIAKYRGCIEKDLSKARNFETIFAQLGVIHYQ